jgi:hypothetical protein
LAGCAQVEHRLRGRSPELIGVHLDCNRNEQIGCPNLFLPCFRLFRKL